MFTFTCSIYVTYMYLVAPSTFTFTLRTWWLHQMDLHDGDQRGIQVVSLRLLRVQNLNRVGTTRNRKDWLQ